LLVVLNARLSTGRPPDAERGASSTTVARRDTADRHPTTPPGRNVALRGTSASSGIAIGPVYLLEDPPTSLASSTRFRRPAKERSDLLRVLAEARRELDDVIEEVGDSFGPSSRACSTRTCRSSKITAS